MISGNNEQKESLRKQGLMLMSSSRLDEAKALLAQICNLDPDDAEAWYTLSNINGMLGKLDEAGECCRRALALRFDYCDAHVNLGHALLGQGKLDAAAASYQAAIQIDPNMAAAYFYLGNLQMQQEQYNKAVENYSRAALLNPADAQLIKAVMEQGRLLMQKNRLEEAKALFTQLCRINPQDAQAWHTLGTIHGRMGEIDAAGDCCRRVIAIQPDHSEAHTNLGHVYFHHRQFDEAIAEYQKALEIDPRSIAALNNMGKACQNGGHIGKYAESYRKAVALVPNPAEARTTFTEVIESVSPAEYSPWLDQELQACFSVDGIDYRLLGSIGARLLKLKYDIRSPIDDGHAFLRDMIGRIAADKLFLMMLEKAVNTDADLEALLTKARRALLLDYCGEQSLGPGEAGLASALAYQGMNNEYVFAVDEEEERRIADLRREIEQSVPAVRKSDAGLESRLVVFGMYEWLSSLSCGEQLSRLPLAEWSETFRPFLTEALLNPIEEGRIKQEIESLGDIADQTSQYVRSQYEENPYPRWLSISKLRTRNIKAVVQQLFPHFTLPSFLDGPIRILVAGCGTGKLAIQMALNYDNADILAMDISKSSLAYATRMARKLGVKNIKFMQGDILESAKLNRRFHVIECGGVLHHMKDPLAGWKALTGLLVEDGLMWVGLYSELARKTVVEAREIIKTEALAPNKNTIRNFRARILRRELGDFLYGMARNSYDFYSTSGCRDLLFHNLEHRYTLPRLGKELDELNLDFIGFILDNVKTANAYRSRFPEDREMKDLDLWDRFEHLHPNTFGRMYIFLCQKKRQTAANAKV